MLLRKLYLFTPVTGLCGYYFPRQKSLQAVKTDQAPKIDGNLDDAAWTNVTGANRFYSKLSYLWISRLLKKQK